MTAFRDIPFGQPVPNSPHAVLCSLPKLADVIGYEERRPEVVAAMRSGYPRFLTNPLVARAQTLARNELGIASGEIRLVQTERLAEGMARFARQSSKPKEWRGAWAVHIPNISEPLALAKAFHQHLGAAITSRQAEDILIAAGVEKAPFAEQALEGDPTVKVSTYMAEVFGVDDPTKVLLTGSGMTGFYAVVEAVRAAQLPRGRNLWLQIGWQYVDTTEVLRKFLGTGERFQQWNDEYDQAGLEAFFQKHGAELAGVVAEFPTNPLLHAGDLPALYALCKKHGVVLIVDPTLASPRVVNVLPHCDVVSNSLTKFAGNQGDVMAGAVVCNPDSAWFDKLHPAIAATITPHYPRDLARLAMQIEGYAPLIEKASASAAWLAQFLSRHKAVREVHWTGDPRAKVNFQRLARRPDRYGSVFSFVPRGDLARFYDRVRIVKGPSFGVNFTLLCPFMYLAHYDLVSSAMGRQKLAGLGLDPTLVRVSVGMEPYEEIEAAFADALA